MKKNIIIILAISGAMISILIIFGVFPLLKQIKENSGKIISIREEINLSDKHIKRFQEYKDNYNKLGLDLEKMDNLFVDPDIPVDLIEFWEEMAKNTELSIEISPFVPRKYETDVWNFIGFKIILTGSFSNFSKFLEKMETSPYLIEIQNLEMKELTARNLDYNEMSAKNVRADLSIKIFTK